MVEVTIEDVEAYHRHRKRLAAEGKKEDPVAAKASAKVAELINRLEETVAELHNVDSHPEIQEWVSSQEAARLRLAAEDGNIAVLKRIREDRNHLPQMLRIISWDIPDAEGNTALMLAAQQDADADGGGVKRDNVFACITLLLEEGAEVNKCNDDGQTALHMANTKRIATLLLEHGANPAAIDNHQRTPYEHHCELHRQARFFKSTDPDAPDDDVHEAFSKKEYQVRGQRVKKGKILNKEELVEAQKINDEIHAARLAQADKEAHDALAAQVEALYNQAVGASAMQVFDTAVGALSQCLAIDPDYKPALVKLRELSSAEHGHAQDALAHLLNPDTPRGCALVSVSSEAYYLAEGAAMFNTILDGHHTGALSFNEMHRKCADFGLADDKIEMLCMMMDTDADNMVSKEDFCKGFQKFKKLAGNVMDSKMTHQVIRHAHTIHKHVLDANYAALMAAREKRVKEAALQALKPHSVRVNGGCQPIHLFPTFMNPPVSRGPGKNKAHR
jgi:hypothetical protein